MKATLKKLTTDYYDETTKEILKKLKPFFKEEFNESELYKILRTTVKESFITGRYIKHENN